MDLKMRLNTEMRQEMLEAMKALLFAPQFKALQERMTKHADTCHQLLFTKKEHEQIASCPQEWFRQEAHISLYFSRMNGQKTVPTQWKYSKPVRTPFSGDPLDKSRLDKDTAAGKRLRVERANIISEWESAEIREEEFMRLARAQMNALKTVGQALEVWPALKDIMGEAFFNRVAPALPMIILSPQNAALEKALKKQAIAKAA